MDTDDRALLLATHRGLLGMLAELDAELDEAGSRGDDPAARGVLVREHAVRERERVAREEYRREVPRVPLSRCPISGEVLHHSLDIHGLDGLWWRYEAPVRPAEETPATFVVLTGAMSLSRPVERTPFLVKPGPDVPYVLPALLEDEAVRAVVSTVEVGRHVGYAIAYFTAGDAGSLPVVATWGADHHLPEYAAERFEESDAGIDVDLAPWIARGRLSWIAPGDASLTLRDEVDTCPYVALAGVGEHQRVEDGEVWKPSTAT